MNGATSLLQTLVGSGVDVCFTNPGTSEMHFVAGLDAVPAMRGVLCLFEGVATGAADGYARMADRPAATLLHLGPGLGNGLANLHNARRGHVPVVNIVGDHATYHERFDAPLHSDIAAIAGSVSTWYRSSRRAADVGADAADAVAAAMAAPGGVATLVLPADVSWDEGGSVAAARAVPRRSEVAGDTIESIAAIMRSDAKVTVLIGGSATRERALRSANRVAVASGAKVMGETFPTRLERGAGLPSLDRLAYLAEFAEMQLAGTEHLVLVDARAPVSFFAYPGKASDLVPAGCTVHVLSGPTEDAALALEHLADALGAPADVAVAAASRPDRPTGALNGETIAAAVGALLPEGAIVADEGNTSGLWTSLSTAGAPRHDWLTLTGGAIGVGMPLATGAAIACPDRRVVNLQADGSAMYTLQSLWTQAREGLDVTTVIFDNRSYAILDMELSRVGAERGPVASSMFDLSRPPLDFTALAKGMGVPATTVTTADELVAAMERSFAEQGPHLIDAIIPAGL